MSDEVLHSPEKTPAEHVIDKFGGLTNLARARGCAVTTVQGWKERGKIPQEHWLPIIESAKSQDIDLGLNDFVFGAMSPATGEAAA